MSNPHISDNYSPLDALTLAALRRMGDMNPGTVESEVSLMFIEFANEILDEVRQHPYWGSTVIPDYVSQHDIREVPDAIIRMGITFKYAMQQNSSKAAHLGTDYFRTMNQVLWNRANGNTKVQMYVVDEGSNPAYRQGLVASETSGIPEVPEE